MSPQADPATPKPVTVSTFRAMKDAGQPIVVVTAYDTPSARFAEEAGVDAILVGDSLGMVVLGHGSTLPVTMEDIARHTAAVRRGSQRAMVIADMPFMSFQTSVEDAMRNAGRLLAEGGAHAVKVESGAALLGPVVYELTSAGIPVMGHVGLTPQSVNAMGGYRVQGKAPEAAADILDECLAVQEAGAFSIVLECIPAELAARVSELLDVPTIGIGAGSGCDGQVQVLHDIVGMDSNDHPPRHARRYADVGGAMRDAIRAYVDDVRDRTFPAEEQTVHMDIGTLAEAELLFGGADEGES